MKLPEIIRIFFLLPALSLFETPAKAVPAGIDHAPWDALLQNRVNERGLVDYRGWSKSETDRADLDAYLDQYAPADAEKAEGDDRIAALINAYNAFTIRYILQNFPTESIRELDSPFGGKRHKVDGESISLDQIEHKRLRPLIGWKAHSVLVCAARSCPPLLNRAYSPENWEAKMRDRYRAWLAREDLNRFQPAKNLAEVSKIFDWYGGDFNEDPSLMETLARFGPNEYKEFLRKTDYRIRFLDYHWGLNAQSDLGKDYKFSFLRSLF